MSSKHPQVGRRQPRFNSPCSHLKIRKLAKMKLSCTVYALVLTLLLSTTFCNARNDVVCAYCKEPRAVEVKTKKPLPEAPCGHRLLDNTLCQSMRLKRLYKCKGCKEHSWGNARRTDDLPQEGT
ncbi:uncharacterized protein PGTG_16748 [Puccinia graminis f. sp. tritici CRL 75-36-700-3]|uniref:Uncharacterized protein n=1 Tax=Puccinia graminis f. sp. tritici (strain CRL 75-36-700-3 / race SCCL) TaxID=418459 RepID=E3L2D5_PUCGT|nr:uncharacterized protein PGTG_16748 [Puccinia graminis f. sp. tritici CRL 75-36-700-3]EFP90722.2 hypothetical protein PGTG_16748 [Puccinia graminis f. sp. tritici CRL 75-36-700-3]